MKTETKFKDVAHLYLGCKLRRGGILTGGLIDASNQAAFDAWADNIPILRPLSSMTDGEMLECGLLTHPKYWANDSNYHFKPQAIVYLLSKGFDMFGLIRSEQAIDATTLK